MFELQSPALGVGMATPAWQVSGQYYETCSCDFVCPCLPGGLAVMPDQGIVHVCHGVSRSSAESYGTVSLDGLGFIVLGFTPEAMGKGNWSVGLIADERATAEQRDAITAWRAVRRAARWRRCRDSIGTFLGVQPAPIRFDRSGAKWSVKASRLR